MQKIPTLFQRNHETDRLVRDEVTPGCEWVIAGEGIATRKHDGTCCLWDGKRLYRRLELKNGKQPPDGYVPASETTGWVPVGDGPADVYHREALECMKAHFSTLPIGTYELCGPKVQGGREPVGVHVLVLHGCAELPDCPRTFEGLREYLSDRNIEGIVWHRPDGRKAKIKGRDFGFKRGTWNSSSTAAYC